MKAYLNFAHLVLLALTLVSCQVADPVSEQLALGGESVTETTFSYDTNSVSGIRSETFIRLTPQQENATDYNYTVSPSLPLGLSLSSL